MYFYYSVSLDNQDSSYVQITIIFWFIFCVYRILWRGISWGLAWNCEFSLSEPKNHPLFLFSLMSMMVLIISICFILRPTEILYKSIVLECQSSGLIISHFAGDVY